MKVVVADRNLQGAEEAVEEFNKDSGNECAWATELDVADWESQKTAFEFAVSKLGRVNYVFPIAGITERPWNPKRPANTGFVKPNLAVLDVNGSGPLYTSSLAIQHFRDQEFDRYGFRGKSKSDHQRLTPGVDNPTVIIVSSACGFYYIPSLPIYTAAKQWVIAMIRS